MKDYYLSAALVLIVGAFVITTLEIDKQNKRTSCIFAILQLRSLKDLPGDHEAAYKRQIRKRYKNIRDNVCPTNWIYMEREFE